MRPIEKRTVQEIKQELMKLQHQAIREYQTLLEALKMVKGQEQLQEEFLLGLRSGYDTITEEMSVL